MMEPRPFSRIPRTETSRKRRHTDEEQLQTQTQSLLNFGGAIGNQSLQRILIQRDTGWVSDRETWRNGENLMEWRLRQSIDKLSEKIWVGLDQLANSVTPDKTEFVKGMTGPIMTVFKAQRQISAEMIEHLQRHIEPLNPAVFDKRFAMLRKLVQRRNDLLEVEELTCCVISCYALHVLLKCGTSCVNTFPATAITIITLAAT